MTQQGRPTAILTHISASKAARPARAAESDPLAAGKKLLELVKTSLDDDKAEDVVVIDLNGKSTIADFMVIASGRSSRQVASMAEHLRERLKAAGVADVSLEGAARADWVLVDGGDVIIHIFRPEIREFYGLEKMWGVDLSNGASPNQRSLVKA